MPNKVAKYIDINSLKLLWFLFVVTILYNPILYIDASQNAVFNPLYYIIPMLAEGGGCRQHYIDMRFDLYMCFSIVVTAMFVVFVFRHTKILLMRILSIVYLICSAAAAILAVYIVGMASMWCLN